MARKRCVAFELQVFATNLSGGGQLSSGFLIGATDDVSMLFATISRAWANAQSPTGCTALSIFSIVAITTLAAAALRAAYGERHSYVKYAEMGIDLAAASMALALTVPVDTLCRGLIVISPQSIFWVFLIPTLAFASMQFGNRALADFKGKIAEELGYLDGAVSVLAAALGFFSLVIASGFMAVRIA